MIEQIKLSSGKLCRGIDVVIKNNEKTEVAQEDFISRIFLPLGADIKYKEEGGNGRVAKSQEFIRKIDEILDKQEIAI